MAAEFEGTLLRSVLPVWHLGTGTGVQKRIKSTASFTALQVWAKMPGFPLGDAQKKAVTRGPGGAGPSAVLPLHDDVRHYRVCKI